MPELQLLQGGEGGGDCTVPFYGNFHQGVIQTLSMI